ncbi:54S ribosomal protein L23, mitochondrial, partial [Mycoemilia scoparia]
VIERAVSGMLPKNRLRKKMMSRLFIFTDNDHPYVKNIYTQYDNKIPLPPQAIAASESKD